MEKYIQEQTDCPHCEKSTKKINRKEQRKYRDLKISEREVLLDIQIPQFYCLSCHRYFSAIPRWAMKGKSYTQRQSKWIFEMCKKQSFTQAVCLLDMCPKTVERLYYAPAEQEVDLPTRYANVRKIGIDAIAHRKGKGDYVCVLTDLEKGIPLDILPNRK